ncbi:Slc16a13 [Symbiodinium sp. CCMP2456]|nr:Slc16a13 [Symbiodinium sp. CCMP2456]
MCCRHGLRVSLRHALLVAVCSGTAVPESQRSGWPVLFRCQGLPSRPFQLQRRARYARVDAGTGFQEALALSEAGRWQAAASAWRGVLEDPSSLPEALRPHAHCALGDALQKLGRDRQAAEEFTAATRLAPGFAAAALRRGTALRRLGDFRGAEAAYRSVLRRSSGTRQATMAELSQACSGAATSMLRQGLPSKAARLLEAWVTSTGAKAKTAKSYARNLLLLALALWLSSICRRSAAGQPITNCGGRRVVELLSASADAEAARRPLAETLRWRAEGRAEAQVSDDSDEAWLARAAFNRLADAPQWALVEDKCSLDRLLKDNLDSRVLNLIWPRTLLLPADSVAVSSGALRDEGGGLSERLVRVVDDTDQGRGDVFFAVGGKTYGALRGVLALHSSFFERMLFGDFSEAQAKEPIVLAQFDEFGAAFRSYLIYVHTMEVKIDSLVQLSDLLSAAQYFQTPDLAAKCEECLQKVEIIPKNCVEMIHVCVKHGLSEQLRRAWCVLGAKADESLTDPAAAVRLLPYTLLRHLFVSSVSNVSEVTLVRLLAVLGDKERGELLPFVRLPLISASDMWNVVVPSGLFESKLCIQALAHQLDPNAIQVSPRSQVDKRTFNPEALIMWDLGIKGEDGPWRLFPGGKAAAFYALKGKGKNGFLFAGIMSEIQSAGSLLSGWQQAFLAVASFLLQVVVVGRFYSYGTLFAALKADTDDAASTLALVGSTRDFVFYLSNAPAGFLVHRVGYVRMPAIGGALLVLGMLADSYAPSSYFLFMSCSLVGGVAMAMIFTPAMTVLYGHGRISPSFLPVAVGLASSGGGLGTVVASVGFERLLDSFSWRGALRICCGVSGLLLFVSVVALWCSLRHKPKQTRESTTNSRKLRSCGDVRDFLQPFGDLQFLLYNVPLFLYCIGFMVPYTHLVYYAETERGLEISGELTSLLGGAGAAGRLCFGLLSASVRPSRLFLVVLLVQGACLVCLPFCADAAELRAFAATYGFSSGGRVVLLSLVVNELFDPQKVAHLYGLCGIPIAFGSILGPTLVGKVYDLSGHYEGAFFAAGGIVLMAVPVFCLAVLRPRSIEKPSSVMENPEKADHLDHVIPSCDASDESPSGQYKL